jgi:hypothetical protein
MTTTFLNPYALSVDFDKECIKYGIHKLTTYGKTCKQTSVMIFGLIITWGYFI